MSVGRSFTLASCLLLGGLACGGVGSDGTEAQPESIEFAKPAVPPPVVQGLAGELGFPVGSGEVQVSDARDFVILHRSTYDAGYPWGDYRARLEADGWSWIESPTPPFEGIFVKEHQQIQLSCELKGSSVFVRGTRLK